MDLLVAILIGVALGVMVELLLPGHTISELFLAMVLGIAGSLVSRYLGVLAEWYGPEEPVSFLACCIGAIAVLLIYGGLFRRNHPRHHRHHPH